MALPSAQRYPPLSGIHRSAVSTAYLGPLSGIPLGGSSGRHRGGGGQVVFGTQLRRKHKKHRWDCADEPHFSYVSSPGTRPGARLPSPDGRAGASNGTKVSGGYRLAVSQPLYIYVQTSSLPSFGGVSARQAALRRRSGRAGTRH